MIWFDSFPVAPSNEHAAVGFGQADHFYEPGWSYGVACLSPSNWEDWGRFGEGWKWSWQTHFYLYRWLRCSDVLREQYLHTGSRCLCIDRQIHPWKLTWNLNMEIWKMIFLFQGAFFRFHVSFQGCTVDDFLIARMLPEVFVYPSSMLLAPMGPAPRRRPISSEEELLAVKFWKKFWMWHEWKHENLVKLDIYIYILLLQTMSHIIGPAFFISDTKTLHHFANNHP